MEGVGGGEEGRGESLAGEERWTIRGEEDKCPIDKPQTGWIQCRPSPSAGCYLD